MSEVQYIGTLLRSPDRADRLSALRLIRENISKGCIHEEYFELARMAILDQDNDCRWQSLIVIGEFIENHPEDIWSIVLEHASNSDEDMKTALATILLEHLLEHHFDNFVPKLRREIVDGKNLAVAKVLAKCWVFGNTATTNWSEIQYLLKLAQQMSEE